MVIGRLNGIPGYIITLARRICVYLSMLNNTYIRANDTVGIISTARKLDAEVLVPFVKVLEDWGLRVKFGKTISLEDHQFAGSDQDRADDLQAFLDDPEIKAIWCARGGYGTARIIDQLDFSQFSKNPKWLIGYSDITALHSHMHNLGFKTLHATMPIDIDRCSQVGLASVRDIIFGEGVSYSIDASEGNRKGNASGMLVGGNLSVLYSLLGSSSSIKTKGKILFLEDLDEYLYHVDRMMLNLKRNGYFDELSGLVVGSMTDMHDNTIPFGKTAKEIILDHTSNYNFPICFDFPAGHLDDNRALIFGEQVELDVRSTAAALKFSSNGTTQ